MRNGMLAAILGAAILGGTWSACAQDPCAGLATNNFDGRNVVQNPAPRLRSYGMGETVSYLMSRGLSQEQAMGMVLLADPRKAARMDTEQFVDALSSWLRKKQD